MFQNRKKASDFPVLKKEGEVFVIREEERIREGQELVAAGYAGLMGSYLAYEMKRKQFENRFSQSFLERLDGLCSYLPCLEERELLFPGSVAVRSGGLGGIYASLWNLGVFAGLGMKVYVEKIPVRQETVEICEMLDLNPYCLYSEGVFLFVGSRGEGLAEALRKKGICAAVIGELTGGRDRLLYTKEGKSYLNRPKPDELYGRIREENKQ